MSAIKLWGSVAAIVLTSVAGDVLLSRAMKKIGDLGELRRSHGLITVISRVLKSPSLLLGICAMALAFFSLLTALSWGDLSFIAPASGSLTFVGNAIAAKFFLREKVDHRRWAAAVLVAAGVALVAF